MNFEVALLIFGLMVVFLWEKKADVFLIVFSSSVFAFLLVFKIIANPISTFQSIGLLLISNPLLVIILLLTPLGVHFIYKSYKSRKNRLIQKTQAN